MKGLIAGLIMVFACPVHAVSIQTLVNGEHSQKATDEERFQFLKYELTRHFLSKSRMEITTCEAKELQKHLLEEFTELKQEDPTNYREYVYCYYLTQVDLNAPNAQTVSTWYEGNADMVHYYYSYQPVLAHFMSFDTLTDWQCKNFRSYLAEYHRKQDTPSQEAQAYLDIRCSTKP